MGEENLETQDKDITTNVDNNVNNVGDAAALEASVSGVTQNSEEKENDSIKERYSTWNNWSMEDEVEKENEKLKMDEGGKVQWETKESAEASKADVVNTTLANQDSKSDIVVHWADVKSELYLNEYEWYLKALNQLLYEIEWCKVTCRYKWSLNEAWKDTLRTAKQKLKQYKAIVSWKKKSLEKEYNSKKISEELMKELD